MVLPKKEKQVAFGSKLFLSIECKMLSMKILGCRKNDKSVGLRNITWILKKGLGVNDILESFCFTHIIKSFVSFCIYESIHYSLSTLSIKTYNGN